MDLLKPGQLFDIKERTKDVITNETVEFKDLHLSSCIVSGLNKSQFIRPSPIQLKAIPYGRCGLDLIVQAKSGTGKTCVFAVVALEAIVSDANTLQVIVLAPTREIAVQIHDVVTAIGRDIKDLKVGIFIGGTPVFEDRKNINGCQIAIGSPGRIKQLIEIGVIKCKNVRLFVLDEADKLLEEGSFQSQINWIFSSLPTNKQIIAASATYPPELADFLKNYMRDPTFVSLNPSDMGLIGLKQYFLEIKDQKIKYKNFEEKIIAVIEILTTKTFQQALIFSNYHSHAKSLCEACIFAGFPSTFISGGMEQFKRLDAIKMLKEFKCRVLISTDLTSRGIDSHNVDIVINMDIPKDWETYLHRIGRAGRFGARGVAISLACEGEEMEKLKEIGNLCNMEILPYHTVNEKFATAPANCSKLTNTEQEVKSSNLNTNQKHVKIQPKINTDYHNEKCRVSVNETVSMNAQSKDIAPNYTDESIYSKVRIPSLPEVMNNVKVPHKPSYLASLSYEQLVEDMDYFVENGTFKVWDHGDINKTNNIEEDAVNKSIIDKTSKLTGKDDAENKVSGFHQFNNTNLIMNDTSNNKKSEFKSNLRQDYRKDSRSSLCSSSTSNFVSTESEKENDKIEKNEHISGKTKHKNKMKKDENKNLMQSSNSSLKHKTQHRSTIKKQSKYNGSPTNISLLLPRYSSNENHVNVTINTQQYWRQYQQQWENYYQWINCWNSVNNSSYYRTNS